MISAGPLHAAPFRSINQALAQQHGSPLAPVLPTGVTAARAAQLGVQNLATAAARFTSISQALAHASVSAVASVPDGLTPGGLQIVTATGAYAPTQAPGTYDVTVKQTQSLAQLTWQTFNIGAHTKLTFDQSAGGAQAPGWIVINTVQDPSANPSQILGSISAPGTVYVLNRNGIAFGAKSSINVGGLVAATADIARAQFGTDATGLPTFSLYGAQSGSGYTPTFINGGTGAITVAPGADITTAVAAGAQRGGSVLLLGANVANAGQIDTRLGQTVLAAGTAFTIRPGSQGSVTAGNTTSTTLGDEVAVTNVPLPGGTAANPVYATGNVANSGIVMADQGDISLVGQTLDQSGILLSTTTVNTRGTIHLLTPTDPAGQGVGSSVTLAPGSVTEILPEDDGNTALDSQRAADVAASITLNAQRVAQGTASATNPQLNDHNLLPDQVGESRIEIATGGSVDFQPGALAMTPGGQVAVAAGGRLLLETGATINVAGSTSAVLPASVNDLLINVQPYQLADSAANRSGGLKSTQVHVDARTLVEIASGAYGPSATNPLGNIYTPGGLLEVGGYLGLIPHGIAEWTAIGGQVTLQSQPAASNALADSLMSGGGVITQPGSVINLSGGLVTYAAGMIPQTYLQAADGQVYNANLAPGNLVYTGLYTGAHFSEPRWHVNQTYINPLLAPTAIMDPSYVVGRDAGSLTVSALNASLAGTIDAGVTLGAAQTGARPATVADPYLLAQTVVPQAGALQIGNYTTGLLIGAVTSPVVFGPAGSATGAPTTSGAGEPTVRLDASQIAASGLATVSVATLGDIAVDAPLTVADGGSVSLAGATIEVAAPVTARGGKITLTNLLPGTSLPLSPAAAPVSITVAAPGALDARGVWTNAGPNPQGAVAPPSVLAGEALANGGSVTIQATGGVDLQAGARIDVSSGGGVLPTGKALAGAGGNITVVADLDPATAVPTLNSGPVTLDAALDGLGSGGAGTLSLTVPQVEIGAALPGVQAADLVVLSTALFQSGFAHYVVDGTVSLDVTPGTQLSVAEPIYEANAASSVPTGGDPASAYTVILPALFTPVRGGDTAAQRAGASLTLLSDTSPQNANGAGGPVTIGEGALVSVDPGQSIVVAGRGSVRLSGTLSAPGGSVTLASTITEPYIADEVGFTSHYQPGLSVWIDAGASIDVSGEADVFTDSLGRRFGGVSAGGTIVLGSLGGTGGTLSTLAQVIEQPGATLSADGASADFNIIPGLAAGGLSPQTGSYTLSSAGGTVVARAIGGIALEGGLSARAGGAGVAGGALDLQVDAIDFAAYSNLPPGILQPAQISVSRLAYDIQPAGLAFGQTTPDATFGQGAISQAQISAGGFGQVSLNAADFLTFIGNVGLQTSQSISLVANVFGDSSPGAAVTIAAPYVKLGGFAGFAGSSAANATLNPAVTASTIAVQSDLLDLQDSLLLGGTVRLGGSTTGTVTIPPTPVSVRGFAQADFSSAGDIRFLGETGSQRPLLASTGDITLRAAQLYPVSGQASEVIAGVNPSAPDGVNPLAGGTLTILGTASVPAPPYSVGGSLALVAGTVVQDGVVRAPQGSLRLGWADGDGTLLGGAYTDALTQTVTLSPGSITSVSLAGQTVPYGGTIDGVSYLLPANTGVAVGTIPAGVELDSQAVDADAGAVIDLRGGGLLTGAGFVVGRGGSADVLRTPLLQIAGGTPAGTGLAPTAAIQPANASDPVYAILPGYRSGYAPARGSADAGYATPPVGAQITVGATVPGLAAGTYTLLPAYYALLPGGFRVELTTGTLPAGTSLARGNFSLAAPVITSVANTGLAAQTTQAAIFTSGAGVRQLSQYDEESYNAFETATGTQFGAPRPALPQDAKSLVINYPDVPGTAPALAVAPGVVLKTPDPVLGGYGATIAVDSTAPIDLLAPGETANPGDIGLDAGVLSGLDAPRLLIGGTIFVPPSLPNQAEITGIAPAITVMPYAHLTAGDIILTAGNAGTITVSSAARLSNTGAATGAFDATNGFSFTDGSTNGAYPLLDISSGHDVFLPNSSPPTNATIAIHDNAMLLASGSLNIVAPSGTSVGIGAALLGGQSVSVAVGDINIGSAPAGAGVTLPTGLDLSPALLSALVGGNLAAGMQAPGELTLTATQAVNILGSAVLDTKGTALVLDTPAIYGFGSAKDTALISTTSTFTWGGVQDQTGATAIPYVTALPGGQIAGSLTNVTGNLLVSADRIVLGAAPGSAPDNQIVLDRLLAGFAQVTLLATSEITANNQSALAVFATQPNYGQSGVGGNLTLSAPLVTTDSGALLKLTAGGALTLAAPGQPAATASVASLGGEIDLTAQSIGIDTAVALPSGRLMLTAQDDISIGAAGQIDLSGRATKLFDQLAISPGGAVIAESTTGSITQAAGSVIDVSAAALPAGSGFSADAQAGSIVASALAGSVVLDGTLSGSAATAASSGTASIIAGTLGGFDLLNTALDAGGFFGARSFEAASGDIAIDSTLRAHTISVAADSGSIDISGVVDASGTAPGSISLAAGQNLTLESGGVLDAHATRTAVDSYGQTIDAENRAHVALTATSGTLNLAGGTIDVSYPGEGTADTLHPTGNPQGQVSLYAPRLDAAGLAGTAAGRTYGDVALTVGAAPLIKGAASIALYATATYTPTDPLGTIGQGTGPFSPPDATVTLAGIDADNTAFIAGFAGLGARRLGGLASYGTAFHVRPGVTIDSSAATHGNLTISGDLDFSTLRYDSGAGYGTPKTTLAGSGEPGSIVFRAANKLTVNGSVSDGFNAPTDGVRNHLIPADDGWVFISPSFGGTPSPLAADVVLPSSLSVTTTVQGHTTVSNKIELGGSNGPLGIGTTFDVTRQIALNYDITIGAALTNPNVVIPFALTLGAPAAPIPAGGWITTAPITDGSGKVIYAQGALIPGGTVLAQGDTLGRFTVLPVQVQSVDATLVPAGSNLSVFAGDASGDSFVTLFNTTAPLPDNALIPANTVPVFLSTDGHPVNKLDLRPVVAVSGDSAFTSAQGQIYPLAAMQPAGSLSWNMDFVAGANQAAADEQSVLPRTVLAGGALASQAASAAAPDQARGSLILADQHDFLPTDGFNDAPAFSVIRTGTGDLSLEAGGNFDQSSLFGIYTAGTPAVLPSGNKPFLTSRNYAGSSPMNVLAGSSTLVGRYNLLIDHTLTARYPDSGGDLRLTAQGSITGDQLNVGTNAPASDQVGNWLFRQGGAGLGQSTAWWINFGTIASYTAPSQITSLQLIGFEGIGTLGGGNVTVTAGTNAGALTGRGGVSPISSEGIVVAVGGTGRLLASGALVQTGGGLENVQIGGALNPLDETLGAGDATNGDFIDLRGAIDISAGSIGGVLPAYALSGGGAYDPRALDPGALDFNGVPNLTGGPNVLPGDATVDVTTLRDLVLGGAGDPGRVAEQVTTYVPRATIMKGGVAVPQTSTGGLTGFSLWTNASSITLFSSGGNVSPTTQAQSRLAAGGVPVNDAATDYRFVYPASLSVTAATGSIVYGSQAAGNNSTYGLETAPAPDGQVAFLAGGSIFANSFAIDMSGAATQGLSTPFEPAYSVTNNPRRGHVRTITDIRAGLGTNQTTLALFAREADTPSGNLHAADAVPEMFYAAGGDIVNLVSGQTITFPASYNEAQPSWYLAAKPVRILAARDIVSSGTRPDAATQGVQQNQESLPQYGAGNTVPTASGDLFLNVSAQSVSVVSAGRDILSGDFYVGGPGLLEVDAGRNLFEGAFTAGSVQTLDFGAIRSLGPLTSGAQPGSTGGADLAVLAGIGTGVDYTAFADLYFNPANQANLALPITDPANRGRVQMVYAAQLTAWLQANYPALSLAGGALAAFSTLPDVDQAIFVRDVFFDETLASGRQFNDPTSRFFGSYVRGRQAIDTLFPSLTGTQAQLGTPAGYTGAITMASGPVTVDGGPLLTDANATPLTFDAGISTQSGGNIQVLDPGGQVLLGTAGGVAPGIGSGIIGSGQGDIDIYANDSILLGRSRIFTIGGGSILAWSSQGDINAGIGASTTVVYAPPTITYSATGQLSETASAPSSGAGIATLQPLPGVEPGNVDLIAPLGTIDAGEAGIRVAGNLNLAAARLANTANITVGGKTTGNSAAPSVSLGAVEAAGAAAGAAASAAQSTAQTRAVQEQPSVIDVEVSAVGDPDERRKKARKG
jgi:filamentous hemagglutinin family protein